MRASTLFALTLAVLAGLGTAAAIKVSGVFNKPPEPQPAAKRPDVPVLVAARNIFAGDLIDTTWVTTRPLRPEELEQYEKNKDQYLPSLPAATYLRVAAKNIEADRPIRREMLQDMAKPESLSHRLLPQMRAVNVAVLKDHAGGGLIQPGEWVDVLLTSQVDSGEHTPISTHTACIAHRLRVIAKRNGLWPVFAPLPEDKPVTFTLEANPYRAALIEYAKSKGQLSLVAVSAAEQKGLEERRAMALANIQPVGYAPVTMENSAEYQDEEARVAGVLKGDVSIGTADLVRIFGIKTTEPPPAAPTPPPQITVQQYTGNGRLYPAVFNADGSPAEDERKMRGVGSSSRRALIDPTGPVIRFNVPKCASCEEKKRLLKGG